MYKTGDRLGGAGEAPTGASFPKGKKRDRRVLTAIYWGGGKRGKNRDRQDDKTEQQNHNPKSGPVDVERR